MFKYVRRLAIATIMTFALIPASAALAFDGNRDSGKLIFLKMGKNKKACMTCHPKGLTTGDVIRGKDVPDLTKSVSRLSEKKLKSKALKHLLQEEDLDVTDEELNDLVTFVGLLPTMGFGPVPPEWESHVRKYVNR